MFSRPTITQLRDQAVNDVLVGTGLPSLLRRSPLRAIALALAGMIQGPYGYLDWIARQSTPFTGTGTFLEAWAALVGILRLAATAATGTVTFTGSGLVPAGTVARRSDTAEYTTRSDLQVNGSGSVAIVASLQATLQRDTFAGDPAGFTFRNRGWGEVWLEVLSIGGATNGLWARPHDAWSAGANRAVGTGTQLHAAVQVYGPISGAGEIRLLLPATTEMVWWDIATDAAFTNPIRIQQRVRVGQVIGLDGRSVLGTLIRTYAYGNGSAPALGTTYDKVTTWGTFDTRYDYNDATRRWTSPT